LKDSALLTENEKKVEEPEVSFIGKTLTDTMPGHQIIFARMTLGMLEGYSGEPTGTYNNVPFLIEKGMIEKSSAISVRFEIMGAFSRR
jgi:hypothetical protein